MRTVAFCTKRKEKEKVKTMTYITSSPFMITDGMGTITVVLFYRDGTAPMSGFFISPVENAHEFVRITAARDDTIWLAEVWELTHIGWELFHEWRRDGDYEDDQDESA